MSRTVGNNVRLERITNQCQITNHIQQFVACRFVGETQFQVIQNAAFRNLNAFFVKYFGDAGYLVITSVASKGPAASAGLRVGDVIKQIDGRPANQISSTAGVATPISVWRGDRETIVDVQLPAGERGSINSRGT